MNGKLSSKTIFLESKTRLSICPGQSDRIDELRDTHRLESHSQSDQIERLRKQAAETEALLKASHDAAAQAESENASTRAELETLKKELERTQGLAKEEEEKRVKAISLLKTVRQKLVKAEKDRDEARGELAAAKEREKGDRDKEEAERSRLQKEIDSVNAERERAVAGLKGQFDKEVAGVKERYEREISALKGQFELEAISTKVGSSTKRSSAHSIACIRADTRRNFPPRMLKYRLSRNLSMLFQMTRITYLSRCSFVRPKANPYNPIWSLYRARTPSSNSSFERPMIVWRC